MSDEAPIILLSHNLAFLAHAGGPRDPMITVTSDAATGNLHDWYEER